MNDQMSVLMRRRGELLARIAVQRGQLADIGMRLQTPLALADQGMAAIRFLRARPFWVAGITAVFVARRRGMGGLLKGVWRLWKGYRRLSAFSAKLSPRS